MDSKQKKVDTKQNDKTQRREFLKKALYTAPTIVVLGGILAPTDAKAYPSDPITSSTDDTE